MNLSYIAATGIAVIVIFLFFSYFEPQNTSSTPQILVLSIPEEINLNENTIIKVRVSDKDLVSFLILKFRDKEIKKECLKRSCTFEFSQTFNTPGIFEIEFIAENNSGKQILQSFNVRVYDTTKSCIDSTKFGECSNTKPIFCQEGILIENCEICDCPEGKECINQVCNIVPKEIKIQGINPFPKKIVRENDDFILKVELINHNNEVVSAGSNYLIKATFLDSETLQVQKEISLQEQLDPNSTKEFELEILGLTQGIYSVNVELFLKEKLIDSMLIENFIESSTDIFPPAKPTGLTANFNGNVLEISWNPNNESDLEGYNLYKSTSIQATHIKYSIISSYDKQTSNAEIVGLEERKHIFVLRAFDTLNNQSEFSQSVIVEKS